MKFTQLLGIAMKDDDMLEVLENYDMSVTYDFDRTHENIDDLYWAGSKEAGFQFRFNKDQILDTVFCYVESREEFEAIDQELLDVPIYGSFDEAKQACLTKSVPYKESPGAPGWWIKLDFGKYTVHYQYKEGSLIMITLSVKTDA
jgi:hypothetical protein